MDIALALARELGPNRSERMLVDPSRSNARLEVAVTGRRRRLGEEIEGQIHLCHSAEVQSYR